MNSYPLNVPDRDDLVFLLFESILNLRERCNTTNRGFKLGHIGAVCLQALRSLMSIYSVSVKKKSDEPLSERVGEVAGVEDEGILSRFHQVGGNLIPAKGTGPGNEERLA
jgi:hypothetical protein